MLIWRLQAQSLAYWLEEKSTGAAMIIEASNKVLNLTRKRIWNDIKWVCVSVHACVCVKMCENIMNLGLNIDHV